MTAAELIAFLRNHPKTCGVLGIIEHEGFFGPSNFLFSIGEDEFDTGNVRAFTEWLSGASTAKADEMDLIIERDERGTWCGRSIYGDSVGGVFCPRRPTRLHATFAAIEASL